MDWYGDVETAFVIIKPVPIPVKGNMAVCCVVADNRTCHIIKLYIIPVTKHENIISCCQQLLF